MKGSSYQNHTNEQLLKKEHLVKGVLIGLGVVALLAIGTLLYLFSTRRSEGNSIAVFVPVLILPLTFVPMLINWSELRKEIKNRNLH